MLEKLRFAYYYAKLRIGVWTGLHHTRNPLNLRWRWHIWRDQEMDARIFRRRQLPKSHASRPSH